MQRLSDDELLKLLTSPESDRVERKESFKGDVPRKAREAVCAFANDLPNHRQPGVLFIGVTDDGRPWGLDVTDQLLLTLSDISQDGRILPLPVMTVERRVLRGKPVAVVTVMPSDMPPVRYDGRIFIRTGPRRAIANEQEERILTERRRHRNLPFDARAMPAAMLADLSRALFEDEYLPAAFASEILEENHRSYEERLASCRMIVSPDDPTPTVLGLLAIGKNPQRFLPGAAIQFLRLGGVDLVDDVIDEALLGGPLKALLQRAEDKIIAHNRTAVDILSAPTHILTHDYPLAAIQQLLFNAVLHRIYEGTNAPIRINWFDDRIEIISPGGPYGNVTEANFGQPGITDYRNPGLADVMKTWGFVQRFGRRIMTARSEMQRNGNPPPEFTVTPSLVTCTLRRRG
jgi:ATP-dependent DNA helicase RecG